MSTSFITLVDLATREDALSFGRYMALTAEDEEKFFDRVSLEVQLAVLFILGFPLEGFLEMKAEEMDNISVEIHTRHGQVIGKFLHGLKQGSPLSVLMSNATLVFKHRVWGLRDPLATDEDPNGYSLSAWNKSIDGDAPPLVSMEGFCDDNSKWNMGNGRDFATLVKAVQWNIKLAGDLSMIFKIGRRGDKTIIELFNVDLDDIHLLPEHGFTSIAWDFKANRPTEEEVDCRVYLKSGLSLPPVKPDSVSDLVWTMLIKGTSLRSERSLGIWRNKFGDTSESADKRAFLFGAKIDRLNLPNLKNDKTIKIAVNSLVVPVYQFGILENKCCPEVYDKMDMVLINKIHKAVGFAWCDAKQLIFVPEEKFGMGIRSVTVEMLKSICRELEIQLNDEALVGKILRGRLEAFKDASFRHAGSNSFASYDTINQGVRNFIMAAIRHIAQYGFFIRDMNDIKATYQIEAAINLAQHGSLFRAFKHHTLGMQAYTGTGSRSGTTLGQGDTKLLWSIIYGRGHTLLNGRATHSNVKLNFSVEQIQAIQTQAKETLQDDLQALYTVFEWSDSNIAYHQTPNVPITSPVLRFDGSINISKNWRRLSALTCLAAVHSDNSSPDNEYPCFIEGLLHFGREDLLHYIDSHYIDPNRLRISDVESLLIQGWPLIIATEGGADKFRGRIMQSTHSSASASVVIFYPPSTPFAQFINATAEEQAHILNQNLLPWKARASPLPTKIGDHVTDNAHAECLAIILMEEWLPPAIPVLLIMDSEAERDRFHHLRNLQHTTNRFLLRSLMSGVSKCLGSRLLRAINKHTSMNDHLPLLFASNIIECCLHAKKWCYNDSGQQSLWKLNQWAPGQFRTVWAIRSHQLDSSFKISPKNRYGSQLVPNRLFASANQWADNVCNAIIRFSRNAIISQDATELRKWCPPPVTLGITGPNFIITFNGSCIDRCVSNAVNEACTQEFVRRLALRPTQGLLIRLQDDLFIKPEMIGRQSYHRRLLEGKTKTHTRAMYTDAEYRRAIIYKYARDENWANNTEEVCKQLKQATKSYRFLRCPFCVPMVKQHHKHLFQDHATEASGLFGNSRHFRFYCLNKQITAVRQQMTQLLENHLTALFRIASKWGRKGFSTLLDRAAKALTKVDRAAYHNAKSMNANFVKSQQDFYACFSANDWITFLESQNEQVEAVGKDLFYQWPLAHQLGFIPANSYTLLEMQDGEYSPCDTIPLGIIPMALQEVVSTFANELGTRHSSEAKKDFMAQWQQVRAVALLRAISVAMVTGAQISDYKKELLETTPSLSTQETSNTQESDNVNSTNEPIHDRKCGRPHPMIGVEQNNSQFLCGGITCSSLFTRTTNLRSSLMRKQGDICRRCSNMTKAIDCTIAVENALAADLNSFRSFYESIIKSDIITIDDIVDAISKIEPLPTPIFPTMLKRTSKRNVFSIVTMTMYRLLNGTFHWVRSKVPTSTDVVINCESLKVDKPENAFYCTCSRENKFFATDSKLFCPNCGGISSFLSTSTRVSLIQASSKKLESITVNNEGKTTENSNQSGRNTTKNYKSGRSATQSSTSHALRDITNIPPRLPSCLIARPDDTELGEITQPYNMISNFVVSYFFLLLANKFKHILYQEFLFDLVKGAGGWKLFVESSQKENRYNHLFEKLSNQNLICIIPICCNAHWTLLVRRFFGNSWKIFFIDSLSHGSEQRFVNWKALFSDDTLLSGEWIRVKVFQQSELECGARVCLHGVCFTLSKKKCGDIINDLSRFKDLAPRSRRMVAHICKEGQWSHPKWLRRTIGDEEEIYD